MPATARLRGCDLTVFYWIFWGRLETTLTGHVSYRFLLWCYFLISYIFLFGAISYFLPISFPAPHHIPVYVLQQPNNRVRTETVSFTRVGAVWL